MKRATRLLLSLAVAVVLLWILVVWGDVDLAEMWSTWRRLPLSVYLLALSVHAGIYVLRAIRFRILIPPALRPTLAVTLFASAAHNLAAYVLPAKTGEAALVLYLKRAGGVGAAEGLATLVVSRVLDVATLCGVFGAACLLLAAERDADPWLLPLGVAFAAAAALGLFAAMRAAVLFQALAGLAGRIGLSRLAVGRSLLQHAGRAAEALRRSGSEGRLPGALAVSLPLWFGVFLFYAVLARGLGLLGSLDLLSATFGSSLAVAFNLLPVNGFAAFGTQEAGWVLGFSLLGVPRDLAFSTGVGVHLVQLLNVALLGVAGHLAMGWVAGRRVRRGDPVSRA